MSHNTLLILGMLVATYSVRWILFGFAQRIHFPSWLGHALSYVPVAVLTALFVPIVLQPHGQVWLSFTNPYLISALIAAFIAWRWQHLLMTIILGLSTFLLLKALL